MIEIVADHILPAALRLLPAKMDTRAARVMLLAIAGEESGYRHRLQVRGPARGLWQFERIAVVDVLSRRTSAPHAVTMCGALLYDWQDPDELFRAVPHNDVLACGLARLNLWNERSPTPPLEDAGACYAYYLKVWRPGAQSPESWGRNLARACQLAQKTNP